jgi:hypothetical protein
MLNSLLRLRRFGVVAACVMVLTGTALAANPPLKTNLDAYFIFSQQSVGLKNFTLLGACNVGVNCKQPTTNSACGVATNEDSFFADGSQLAADVTRFNKAGASVWQLFTNQISNASNVTIRLPGSKPDGSDPLVNPILDDLDMDGNPSCSSSCVTDPGDLYVACGFPSPVPACNPGAPVNVPDGSDCLGVADALPGNSRCDLQPGVYGDLKVQNGAMLQLTGGDYVFCNVSFGRSTVTTTNAPSTLLVHGDFGLNNDSTFGTGCNDIRVLANGQGDFSFGRHATVMGRFCGPERRFFVGHDNDLTGQFIGDIVQADSSNRGHCCAPSGGLCTCFDSFSPNAASVGDTITVIGACDLTLVTSVTICDIAAPITVQTAGELHVTVPAGAAGACAIKANSPAGTYVATATLTVS